MKTSISYRLRTTGLTIPALHITLLIMEWGLLGFILAIIFGIATVVSIIIAVRLARRRRPSWAYRTEKVVGLGSSAPKELKLTFGDTVINDVYQTTFILYNRGNEPILAKDDVIRPIVLRLGKAQILREPTIRPSNYDIMFTAKRDNDCVKVDFKYLDHNDGAVVDVLHTKSDKLDCQGKIMGVKKISYLGEFEEQRLNTIEKIVASVAIPFLTVFILWGIIFPPTKSSDWIFVTVLIIGMLSGVGIPSLIKFIRLRRFPSWSRQREII